MASMTLMALPIHSSPPASVAAAKRSLAITNAEACRLASAVALGDEAAFRELYDRYHARLLQLVVVLSRGDQVIAHEVVQSVMLTAAEKLKRVESEDHLWHW